MPIEQLEDFIAQLGQQAAERVIAGNR